MAEISINPFGQTDEMPTGINVINRLDSNNTRSALSAAQGMRLKGMIDAIGSNSESGEITRYAVNMCDTAKMVSGNLSNSGELTAGSGFVTDYIPTAISNRNTQYIQVCASVFKTNAFGYRASKVCIYDVSKAYIGAISSVSAVIDKESSANTSLFANAAYIRVQFAANTTDHYVALSNRPVLPQYSPYDKGSLTATAEAIFPKIHNTDGAISNMLETALDYVNNHTALGLGYGDSATAYDESCEAVTCDPWNQGAYTGEKKQINCSTFVMLCLEGVRYANSRYALGSSAKNHGNGYVFDDKTETNYHNAKEGDSSWSQYSFVRHIPCSSHNKLYANRMLKYAHDRGFAFLVEDGLKNLEVGDVLFSSNSSGTYKDVGHTLFVSAVSLKNDGTKIISIMEDGTSGVHETTGITTRDSRWVYAARFPLPHTRSKAINIVTNIAKEASFSTLASGTTKKIGTLTLSENVKAHGVYTAVIKCSAVGDFEVMVGTYSGSTFSPLSTNGETLFRRGDGVTVKHIHLPVDSSVNTNSLAVTIKTYAALSSNVEIEDAKVYNGYVTE